MSLLILLYNEWDSSLGVFIIETLFLYSLAQWGSIEKTADDLVLDFDEFS